MTTLEELTPNQIMQLAGMTHQLANDPATRADYLRLVKKRNPNVPIPEIDAVDHVNGQIDALKADNEKLRQERQEEKLVAAIEKKRASVIAKHKLTDDQMTEIEKLMVEKHLPDYDTAAEFFTMQNKVAAPTPSSIANPDWKMPDSAVWNKGIGNKQQLDKIAREQAYAAWNEVKGAGA
jgi:hypothetical protein